MTAPQHTAHSKADKQDSSVAKTEAKTPSTTYQQRRCWFMALGLLGGFGFVASQMSFARAEGDFLINDYASNADSLSGDYSVSDTTFSASGSASTLQPLPDAFIDAPPAPAIAAETYVVDAAPAYVPPAPAAPQVFTPAPAPVVSAPAPVAAPVAAAPAVKPAVPVVAVPVVAVPVVAVPVEPSAPGVSEPVVVTPPAKPAAPVASKPKPKPSITIEIEPAQSVRPEVTAVAPPTFASVRKPAAKAAKRGNPLVNLIEAQALSAPFSASRGVIGRSAATLGVAEVSARTAGTLVAMDDLEAVPADIPDFIPAVEAPPAPAPEIAAPPIVDIAPIAEEPAPIQATELVPAALPEGTNLPEEYNSIFVDPTDYSIGATQSPDVVVSEQSTGCEFTVGAGGSVPNGACGTGRAPASAPVAGAGYPQAYQQAPIANNAPANTGYSQQAPVASAPAVNVGPVSFSTAGIRFSSSTTAAGREYLNRSVRPMVNLQAAEQFIFPLAIPAPITSLFGFRIHPISGDHRFHAGTDIGAEQGTPVLAAQDGEVVSANYAGGYGLMVVLEHKVEATELQSRYAHLSDILVEPGKTVKKGDVIGLVGSTGNSTGPHLHFEMLQNTADGWVLVNADGLVQNSLAKLVTALNNPLKAMQAMNFSLADLNLSTIKKSPAPAQPGVSGVSVDLPGQNGVPFRPAQPNAS